MSDQIDVAGLILGVLGAIPAGLMTLQFFHKHLAIARDAKYEILKIKRELENEHRMLEKHCQALLSDIAFGQDLITLLQRPGGSEWIHYRDELRLRLGDADETTKETIRGTHHAILELRRNLGLDENWKIDPGAIGGARFTLRRGNYLTILEEIKDANGSLKDFLDDYNPTRELLRRSMSEHRLMRIMRRLYCQLFEAIRMTTPCDCEEAHSLCLELEHRRRKTVLPTDEDESVALGVVLHVVLGSGNTSDHCNGTENVAKANPPVMHRTWDGLSVKLCPMPTEDSTTERSGRKVHWDIQEPIGAFYASSSQPWSEWEMSTIHKFEPPACEGLCQLATQARYTGQQNCRGHLGRQEQKFNLLPRGKTDISCSDTVLDAIQKARTKSPSITMWPLWLRLRTAHDISTAFMYLFNTPWLLELPSLDDFLLLMETEFEDVATSDSPYMSRTFVGPHLHPVPRRPGYQERSIKGPGPAQIARLAILTCGCLLAQILRGRLIEELKPEPTMSEEDIFRACQRGKEMAQEIETQSSTACASVVRWCFDRARNAKPSKGDDQWLHFHREVVVTLETALREYEDVSRVEMENRGFRHPYVGNGPSVVV